MRSLGTATLLIALTVLTGCGSGDGDADDVPTITTRPSSPATSTPLVTEDPTPSSSATSDVPTTEPTQQPSSETPTETGPSPEPPTDDPVGPTTYRAARERIASGPAPAQRARFSTPDDVIYCLLDDPVIGPACELRRGFIKDDEVCGGAAEGVGRIETFEGEARPVCNSDTIREPGAEVLEGTAVALSGDVECLVDSAGVTCVDTGAHTGFFLAPGEYHVF
jgi:hypothetical protein